MTAQESGYRVDWVDYGKGICIILVVMMHSTYGYGAIAGGEGWMHHVVEFAKPIRMPDFFLIAGLFLSRSIHGPLADYIDKKVIHFAYFYVLWLAIQNVALESELLLADPLAFAVLFAKQLIFPSGSLWFLHQLLVFYVLTRLLRNVPAMVVLAAAALLQTLLYAGLIETGWSVTDRIANWYVFFFTGYACAPMLFRFASLAGRHKIFAIAGLAVWGLTNWGFVAAGLGEAPIVALALGMAGAGAIIAVAAILAELNTGNVIRYAGQHSIVIYLTFFVPMKVGEKALGATGLIPDIGFACLTVLVIAVGVPLAIHALVRGTPLNFLYRRPALFTLNRWQRGDGGKARIAPAE
ncbi:acyltransferase family protein [Aquisalinus flavus]|uniref:Acyltransferase n=1 Tax=Aquisalinus flavus TaxID=1526572 RepID=A0A8J2V625_9PROT|nr:acyltransferase family protein [Aquisalinus flavus]MBD0427249.1 acyltransferase family protein [Aquisalinus flavus]UNE47063.1 acyltransferase family protein [Aquisalinus flavus]GGC99497.1 acyltransferase [Aquisalinus flavus]